MVDIKDVLSFNYYTYKKPFTGSDNGKRYRIVRLEKEVQAEEIAVYHLVEEEMDSEEIAKEKVKREMFLEGDDAPYKDFRIEEVLKAGENGNFSGEDFIGTGYTEE